MKILKLIFNMSWIENFSYEPELLDELQGEHDEELDLLQLEEELGDELELELWLHEELEE